MWKKNKAYIAYLLIILAQLLVFLYWANEKENFYIDELFSLGYASSYTGTGDTARYLTESEEWEFDKWTNNSEYKKQLRVSDQESLLNLPIGESIKKSFMGRNYFALLNIAESIAHNDDVSAWPAIILNMLIFVAAELALLSLMTKLKLDLYMQYLALALFGFSTYAINIVTYVRFYTLVVALLLLMFNLLYSMWVTDKLKHYVAFEIALFILTFLGIKDSELMVPFFCFAALSFVIALAITKQYKKIIVFVLSGVIGAAFLSFKTNLIEAISNNSVFEEAIEDLRNSNMYEQEEHAKWVVKLLLEDYFGGYMIVMMASMCLLMYFLWKTGKDDKDKDRAGLLEITIGQIRIKKERMYAFGIWIVLCAFSFFIRKGWLICFATLILYLLIEKKGAVLLGWTRTISRETAFVCVLAGAAVLYTIFTGAASFGTWRYYSFAFVSISIIIWYALDHIIKFCVPQKNHKGMLCILTFFVFLSALAPFVTRNAEFIYEEDGALRKNLEQYRNMDTIIMTDDGFVSRIETYDCVVQLSDKARIYAVNLNDPDRCIIEYPDSFLVWTGAGRDIASVTDGLTASGYTIDELGSNHASKVCLCTKNKE